MVRLQVHPGIQELEEVRIPEQVEDPVPGGFVSDLIEFSAELDRADASCSQKVTSSSSATLCALRGRPLWARIRMLYKLHFMR